MKLFSEYTLQETTKEGNFAKPTVYAIVGKVMQLHHQIEQDKSASPMHKRTSEQLVLLAALLAIQIGVAGDDLDFISKARATRV
jgi:hypothetical protein